MYTCIDPLKVQEELGRQVKRLARIQDAVRSDTFVKLTSALALTEENMYAMSRIAGFNYGNGRKLDDLSAVELERVVKALVRDDPVLLVVDCTHDVKRYALAEPVSGTWAQIFYVP
ncbi:hypothetical protein L3N51_02221 [Metallosphaera sp. J1]|uniref:hypothetical protein n=1 Tax=Metallosphaera javensis (ex Hofmann et al. 2022) TaxID=99938 RepID=UPI001EDF6EA7|nr:hypothetical protein [Metallosphaera javensis (ex Hofmann et al. 2022)]MCG3109924.1 hypothetical protein [Metallosphaera javensis (ex Hofmann et al. 2022)]